MPISALAVRGRRRADARLPQHMAAYHGALAQLHACLPSLRAAVRNAISGVAPSSANQRHRHAANGVITSRRDGAEPLMRLRAPLQENIARLRPGRLAAGASGHQYT